MEMSCFDMIGAFFVSIFTVCAPAAEPTDTAQKPPAQAPAQTADEAPGGSDTRSERGEAAGTRAETDGEGDTSGADGERGADGGSA